MRSRRELIKRNITGGTSAPRSAAGGPTTGLNQRRPANRNRTGLSGNRPAQAPQAGLDQAPQPGAAKVAQPALLPWDVAAANSISASGQSRDNALTSLDSQWTQRQQHYGLEGPWADYTTNPYSQAALLQRSYDIANRSAVTGSGRMLYSGSQINARNANTRQFNEGRDQLQRAAASDFAEYQGARTRTGDEYREAVAEAEWDRVNAGVTAGPPPAGAPGPKKQKQGGKRKGQIKRNIGIGQGRRAR